MTWTKKHLLDIESLTAEEITTILDTNMNINRNFDLDIDIDINLNIDRHVNQY